MSTGRISLPTFVCLLVFTNVSARTVPSCPENGITILDKVTGKQQCEVCRNCPAGEGLSVKCGDVITPQTPVSCNPCILGESYSSANEPGACKECDNCGEFRETKTNCTLTSNAVCGKCKIGAYPEGMLAGMCMPCSPCCNDDNDIFIAECQVPGVPANMQCSYARSEKCRGKVVTSVMVKPIGSTHSSVHITPAMVTPSTLYASTTTTVANVSWYPEQQPGNLANAVSPPRSGAGVGLFVAVAAILFAFIWFIALVLGYRYTMSRQARRNRNLYEESTVNGRLPQQEQGNSSAAILKDEQDVRVGGIQEENAENVGYPNGKSLNPSD